MSFSVELMSAAALPPPHAMPATRNSGWSELSGGRRWKVKTYGGPSLDHHSVGRLKPQAIDGEAVGSALTEIARGVSCFRTPMSNLVLNDLQQFRILRPQPAH